MEEVLFISDLHLDKQRPEMVQRFASFIKNRASYVNALYILGDLFEYWIGDDDPAKEMQPAIQAIASLHDKNVPVYFIHGNRDFLISSKFASITKCKILDEHVVIDLFGEPTLIMHGDTLCVDDISYQRFRKKTRNKIIQKSFLFLNLKTRLTIANYLRKQSMKAISEKPEYIMDVSQDAVIAMMQKYNVYNLIHGHTHRPNIHNFTLNSKDAKRIVLGDWYATSSALSCKPEGFKIINV